MSHDHMVYIGEGFWNIRGTFKIAGLLNVGTQSSLVRLKSGNFVLLDAYTLSGDVARQVMALTEQGSKIEAVIHLHPFHTIHVDAVAQMLPHARQYGTNRHHKICPDVSWEVLRSDSHTFHELYAEDFDFSVPRGVDLIPEDESVHFSSVLAIHKASRTLHVDDTLTWLDVPVVGGLSFHMTLKDALQKRAGAATEFRQWADDLIAICADVDHLCTAHGPSLPPDPDTDHELAARVHKALDSVHDTLTKHTAKYG